VTHRAGESERSKASVNKRAKGLESNDSVRSD
jgi:hypothetical protein